LRAYADNASALHHYFTQFNRLPIKGALVISNGASKRHPQGMSVANSSPAYTSNEASSRSLCKASKAASISASCQEFEVTCC